MRRAKSPRRRSGATHRAVCDPVRSNSSSSETNTRLRSAGFFRRRAPVAWGTSRRSGQAGSESFSPAPGEGCGCCRDGAGAAPSVADPPPRVRVFGWSPGQWLPPARLPPASPFPKPWRQRGVRNAAERSRRTGSGPRTSRCPRGCPQRDGRGGVGGAAAYGVPQSWRSEVVFSWRAGGEVEGDGVVGHSVPPFARSCFQTPHAGPVWQSGKGSSSSSPAPFLPSESFFKPT